MPNYETGSNLRQSSIFMEALQDKLKDKLKDIKNFSNWPAKKQIGAVTAVGMISGALLPVVAVALPVAATGAAVALTLFFAVKAVEYGYEGLKWSAEKTWEGAKYTAGKIKAGYEHSVDSLKRGSGKVKSAIGSALETVGRKISSTGEDMNTSYKLTDSTDTGILLLTEDGKKEYNSIRNALRNISDKHLLKKISSEMVSLIDSKIESEKNMIDFQNEGNLYKSEALISRWIKQKNSIVELGPKGLQKRLSYEGYDHDLYQIFSEHHNEIKEVISQCKREYEFDQSVKRNNAKDEEKRKDGKSSLFPSLGRKSPKQPDNLSRSSSMNSLNSASSTVGLLTGKHKKVKAPISTKDKVLSWFRRNKEEKGTTKVKYQVLSEPGATQPVEIRNSTYVDLQELPKVPGILTSNCDSGINSPNPSGSSTPKKQKLFGEELQKELEQRFAKLRASPNKLLEQQTPSTHVFSQKSNQVNQKKVSV